MTRRTSPSTHSNLVCIWPLTPRSCMLLENLPRLSFKRSSIRDKEDSDLVLLNQLTRCQLCPRTPVPQKNLRFQDLPFLELLQALWSKDSKRCLLGPWRRAWWCSHHLVKEVSQNSRQISSITSTKVTEKKNREKTLVLKWSQEFTQGQKVRKAWTKWFLRSSVTRLRWCKAFRTKSIHPSDVRCLKFLQSRWSIVVHLLRTRQMQI